jgi:hypothetical protein
MSTELLVFGAIIVAALVGGIKITISNINIGNKTKNDKTE